MKLSTGLKNFKGVVSDDLSFVSVEIDKNYWLTLSRWRNLCYRLSCDQPPPGSFFQRPREAEKRDPGNEVGFQIASFSPSTLAKGVFKKRRFQIAPLWRAFSNGSVFGDRFRRCSADDSRIRSKTAPFLFENGLAWTGP